VGQGARRALKATLGCLLACPMLAGCADFGDPGAATTATTRPQSVLHLGENIRTGSGNVVAVLDYEFPAEGAKGARVAAAFVEACAGAAAAGNTGASPAFFRLELADRRGVPPRAPVREPALKGVPLKRGECADGWVSFDLAAGDTPRYVTFRGSSVAKWEVAR
jgi:hypothetical protein